MRHRLPLGAAGIGALVLVWSALAATVLSPADGVPTPWAVLRQLRHDGWAFYAPHVLQTGGATLRGFLLGNGLALAAALLVALVPLLERPVVQLAVASYCLPLAAVGPLLSTIFAGDTASVALAGVSVFFTTLVGALLGLRTTATATLDVVRACGGGRWQQLRRVRLVAALPATFAALRIAAPSALLGAMVGEYLGRVDRGLGVALTVSEQQLQIARTWGIALVCGALAGTGYALLGLLSRLALPWARPATGGGDR
ncbi:ABC transporter permease [Dactylosporangium matsuzakiense]|uniref:ABC transporter permease n=1 Tax=Dactylosporangium matsuzakiense TaxID=53360 RepID=A0A9W6KCZ5_9ACTN|nr:ABC transporter permease subunit [Dactylosporangium matsuzakiense]GLK99182.1 ABC transporter permease [Dactylosporangium matsuzakiense]